MEEMTFEELRAMHAARLDFWLAAPSRGNDPVRSAALRRRQRILGAKNMAELEAAFVGFP